jgi:undecaprenyl diphosphate synthase
MLNEDKIKSPRHVAIIMDGNGRWARKKHKPRIYGHQQGARHAMDFIELFANYGIPYLTLYVFSTENWNRPRKEVDGIIGLLKDNFAEATKTAVALNIRIRHLGKLDRLPEEFQEQARKAIEITKGNTGLNVNIAFNYGGRSEITEAVKQIVREKIPPEKIDEMMVSQHLYTDGIPDPDLLIRTGNEMRTSNFLIWQAAYAELYFTSALWPDFDREELEKALLSFNNRQRRFGGL